MKMEQNSTYLTMGLVRILHSEQEWSEDSQFQGLCEEMKYVCQAMCVSYLMPRRTKGPSEKGLGIAPNGVKWEDRVVVDPRVHSSRHLWLQLICHGLAQDEVKSLWLEVKNDPGVFQAVAVCPPIHPFPFPASQGDWPLHVTFPRSVC